MSPLATVLLRRRNHRWRDRTRALQLAAHPPRPRPAEPLDLTGLTIRDRASGRVTMLGRIQPPAGAVSPDAAPAGPSTTVSSR